MFYVSLPLGAGLYLRILDLGAYFLCRAGCNAHSLNGSENVGNVPIAECLDADWRKTLLFVKVTNSQHRPAISIVTTTIPHI